MYTHQMTRRQADPSAFPCACTALRKASRAVSRHYEACLSPTGTTATQFSILRCLQREGPLPQSRIADMLVMERTSLYRAIAPLEREGLVELRIDPGDARAKLARLTRKGAVRIAKILPHWRRAQRSFLDAVGGNEWVRVSSRLDRILRSVQETTLA